MGPTDNNGREKGSVHIDIYKIELNMTIPSWSWFTVAEEEQRMILNFLFSSTLRTRLTSVVSGLNRYTWGLIFLSTEG